MIGGNTALDVLWFSLMGLLVIPLGFGLLTLGPRYIPVPEVGLMLLLESVLGPFLVWLVLGVDPGAHGLIGGAIVISTLVVSNIHRLKQ